MSTQAHGQLRVLTWFLITAATVTLLAVVVGSAPVVSKSVEAAAPPPPPPSTTTTTPPATTTTLPPTTTAAPLIAKDLEQIRNDVAPAVAFITTLNGSGSGVLVGDSLLVTNAHVVWPFQSVGVLFDGDSRRVGRVIGIDARADLAFVEVDSPRLPEQIRLGTARELAAGAPVYVVGYPAVLDFTPDATIVEAAFGAIRPWEFSGADWVTADAAAVGGQSGGALVDEFGRLVGITTFGSPATLYSISVEDVAARIPGASLDDLTRLTDRLPPRTGGLWSHDIDLEGPWDQAAFVTWLNPGARSSLESSPDVRWRALDPFGAEIDSGSGALDVQWGLATPGVILGRSQGPLTTTVDVSLPMVLVPDPDDARDLALDRGLTGFVDVPGDRDWFYLTLDEQADTTTVVVEAQTRVRIALYNRDSGALIAEVDHERGFFFEDPALVVDDLPAGNYVVTVDDIAAQFGTYRIEVG